MLGEREGKTGLCGGRTGHCGERMDVCVFAGPAVDVIARLKMIVWFSVSTAGVSGLKLASFPSLLLARGFVTG